ncbi:hypothetical protein M513_05197, partial [Trichuris suis]
MWLGCPSEETGFQVLSDDEITRSILKQEDKSEDEVDEGDETEAHACPSHNKAFKCLEIALQWFERQRERDSKSLLCLKGVRDLAAQRWMTALKQTSTRNSFKESENSLRDHNI